MDYMVYVDNSNDRFSLLDMIEKDCQALDTDEKWHISHSAEVVHADKNKLFTSDLRQSVHTVAAQLTDTCWLDSSGVKIVPSVQESVNDATAGVNKDPHLLVNPRTVAPVLENDAAKVAVSAVSVTDRTDVTDVSISEVEPSAKIIKIEPVSSECEMLPAHAQIVSLTDSDQSYSTGAALLAPASVNVSSPVGTMQVFLQVASTVGNFVQTGGNVCFVVEPQTLCTAAVTHNSDADSVPASGSQLVDTDLSVSQEIGSEAYEKPVFSYSCLIAMALKNSDTGSLPVNEIYAYILEKFPYFRSAPDGWKNSIRHNLSLNKCFEKIENPTVNGGSRKGCLWGLNPAKADKMDEEIAKWIKRASKSNGPVNGVAGGNLVDCSASVVAQAGDSALINNITDDCTTGAQHSKTGQICHDAEQSSGATQSESDYFTMLEDSFSSDPMLAGLAVQNGLWDDLTETDELMSTAMSFSGSQLASRTAVRVKRNPELQSTNAALLASTANSTCRSYHSKAAAIAITSGRPVETSDVIVISQPAIG